ncbi:type III secretion system effector XopQ [Erwinia mallotivora]|uniref:type III secretion system effector XopQ n=1 Tax=Erwinia mallotivora TaxID=69222 RepID=UPI0035F08A2B
MMKQIYRSTSLPVLSHRWKITSTVQAPEKSPKVGTEELAGTATSRTVSHAEMHLNQEIHTHLPAQNPTLTRSQSASSLLTPAQRTLFLQLATEPSEELTEAEAAVLRELKFHKSPVPANTWLFTDPNKDPDDVVTYTLGKQLQSEGFLYIKNVVPTLGDVNVRAQRAEMAKGVFNHFELPDVHVVVGQDYSMSAHQAKDYTKFLPRGDVLRAAPDDIHRDRLQDMKRSLEHSSDGLNMVVIAGMTDVNALITACPDLMRQRVDSITIMGGVEPVRDKNGTVQPDTRSYNNATDLDAARHLYRKAQDLGIPLRIVTKEAAYRTAVSPAFYEGLAKSGHPVGQYLRDVQKSALKGLWEGIQAGLLPGLNNEWFGRTFMTNAETPAEEKKEAHSFDDIWPKVTKLNLYDPLTLLASVRGAASMLFEPTKINTEGRSTVDLISEDNIKHPEKARLLMSALAKSALASQTK